MTEGKWPNGRALFYSSYLIVLAIAYIVLGGVEYVFVFQILCALISLVCLYKITQKISGSNQMAFISGVLYLCWFKFFQWNLILYTESLFTSFVVITAYIIFTKKGRIRILLAPMVIVFTVFLRPTGMGLLVAVLAIIMNLIFQKKNINRLGKALVVLFVMVLFLIGMNIILRPFVDSFIDSYAKAEILYPNQSLFLNVAEDFKLPPQDCSPIVKMLLVWYENPIYMMRLTGLKVLLFLFHAKPYYSVFHNIYIFSCLIPLYFFALRGCRVNKCYTIFSFSFLFFQVFTVGLTSENWDGRFLLPVIPLLVVLATLGVYQALEQRSAV
ncbi:glycosyltransferase family 39 protein [Reichenbachiella ulvae]|uniref:Glycosyltransferase family 39 protein n=1 Tax=Reichenbachiella ulvae TaxID=2980104 RepID=A0ABT3CNX8_9BACT|nr:glycosyltransferase family 39 protein [Reichenbachiella ulvae]MCV9385322.1 glycosyltransferase family 39 protein [Reichenbachiella ulvae]